MTETSMRLIELLQKRDDGDFLRAVAEAVLQLLMEQNVEGLIGTERYARGDGRLRWRDGYRAGEIKSRLGILACGCQSGVRPCFPSFRYFNDSIG